MAVTEMTLTGAKALMGLVASATPTKTNVTQKVKIGEDTSQTAYADADAILSLLVTADAAGDVCTVTVRTGVGVQTTQSPVITDGAGLDFEGNDLSAMATLYSIAWRCTVAGDIDIAGTLGLADTLAVAGDRGIKIYETGLAITTETLTLTFNGGTGAAEITILGKIT